MRATEIARESAAADASFRVEFQRRGGTRFVLRRAGAEDQPFLRELFASVQLEAARRVGSEASWLAGGPLLDLQFASQCASYNCAYPHACHYLVQRREDGAAVGRMLIDWASDAQQTIGIDLAVAPSARTGAVGLHLMRAWLATCDHLQRPASLHVVPHNPARMLYRKLGFVETDSNAFPVPMLRTPRNVHTP